MTLLTQENTATNDLQTQTTGNFSLVLVIEAKIERLV